MTRYTLTQKLFFSVLPTILAVLLLVGGLAFHSCRYAINNMYDTQLANNARVLWTLVSDDLDDPDVIAAATPKRVGAADLTLNTSSFWLGDTPDYGDARMFRIWRDGRLVMLSDTAFISKSSQPPGFSVVRHAADRWRVYTLVLPREKIMIEMGEKFSLRYALISNILLNLFVPLLVLVPLIGLALWRGIRGGLTVTRGLVTQIQSRSPDDLSAVAADSLPRDLAPLGQSINKLFAKLAQSISAERRFADLAAHQLRTPLAGSKLLIQMLKSADSEAERAAILADLTESNEQAEQLVKQLLIAARVSHQPITLRPVNLYDAAARGIAALGPILQQKRLDLMLSGVENAIVMADGSLLAVMIDNVIENAIKYTPPGGQIRALVSASHHGWCLSVADNGPGITEDEKKLVFTRFYRTDSAVSEGSGLGLTIVADIMQRFGGVITLATPEGGVGLRVEMHLPAASAAVT